MIQNILFTGATGFLGKNILPVLKQQNYEVTTLGLPDGDIICDLSTEIPVFTKQFDVILHAAGKAHVIPRSIEEEKIFFDINLQGTKNLCAGLEKSGLPKAFIFISTVAVYGCESGENITEEHPLMGNTPYALSKIQAEQFLLEWTHKHNVILTILRPSLIAGVNPVGNLGNMIKGIQTRKYLSIAGGKAKKSILMAQDIVNLIPLVAIKGGTYNICDNTHPSFRDLEFILCKQLKKRMPVNIPYGFAKALALVGDCIGAKAPINSQKLDKITKSLTFSNQKAKTELGWEPLSVLENFMIK